MWLFFWPVTVASVSSHPIMFQAACDGDRLLRDCGHMDSGLFRLRVAVFGAAGLAAAAAGFCACAARALRCQAASAAEQRGTSWTLPAFGMRSRSVILSQPKLVPVKPAGSRVDSALEEM
jgi:hypothetical protein